MNLDLGKKPQEVKPEAPGKSQPKVYYPSIHISDVAGLEDLPEGDFEFTGTGTVTSKTISKRNGKSSVSVEIEIKSLECDCETEEEPTIEDALDKVAAKKTSKTITQDEETDEEE